MSKTIDMLKNQLEVELDEDIHTYNDVLEIDFSPELFVRCEPAGVTNDAGAEKYELSIHRGDYTRVEKHANPDILATIIFEEVDTQ